MTSRLSAPFALALLLTSLLIAGNASAQQITTRTTAGTYSVVCDGYLTFPNPFPPTSFPPSVQFAPAKALGTATGDSSGHFTGSVTLSVGGFAVVTQAVSGTETVNPDGTGAISYATTIDGNPGPPLDISFVVSEYGDRIDGLTTDPGTVFACVLRRISRKDGELSLLNPERSPRKLPAAQSSNKDKSAAARLAPAAARLAQRPSAGTLAQ